MRVEAALRQQITELTLQLGDGIGREHGLERELQIAKSSTNTLEQALQTAQAELTAARTRLAETLDQLNKVQAQLSQKQKSERALIDQSVTVTREQVAQLSKAINDLGFLLRRTKHTPNDYKRMILDHLTLALRTLFSGLPDSKKANLLDQLRTKLNVRFIPEEIRVLLGQLDPRQASVAPPPVLPLSVQDSTAHQQVAPPPALGRIESGQSVDSTGSGLRRRHHVDPAATPSAGQPTAGNTASEATSHTKKPPSGGR